MKTLVAGLFLLFFSLFAGPAAGQPEAAALSAPYLQVRGEAELQVPADQFSVSIGVLSRAETARDALERNSVAMNKVEQVFHRLGLEKQEYRTARFSIQPLWTRPPEPARQPEIAGFTVTNSFMITTTRLELAGPLIEAAVREGANSIGDLAFGLAAPSVHRAEAIRRASDHARGEALSLAAAAGVTLEEVLILHLDQAAASPQRLMLTRMDVMSGEPPLAPGEVAVRAGVTITYRIAPAGQP